MTDGSLHIKDIVIDCDDVDLVASFWSELLRRPVIARTGPYVSLDRRDGLGVVFQRTSAPKVAKNRVHLDLGSDDPPAEQRRAGEDTMPDADIIYRCSDDHLYTAPGAKALLLSVHLGVGKHFQRCPVDRRWRTANRVDAGELSEEQLAGAREHRF